MADGQALQGIRALVKFSLGAAGFCTDVSFDNGIDSATIQCLTPVHHMQFDDDGQPFNGKEAAISLYANDLIEAGYPLDLSVSKPSLNNVKVTFTDASGTSVTYNVKDTRFDRTFGNMVLILEDYTA